MPIPLFGKLISGTGNPVLDADLVETTGNSNVQDDLDAKEDSLGNPSSNGQVLSSTTAGVRSWVNPGAAGDVNELSPLASTPATTGYSVGDVINVNGDLLELVDDTDDSNVIRGTGAADGANYVGVRANIPTGSDIGSFTDPAYIGEFEWAPSAEGIALVRCAFARNIWPASPPANLYIRFVDAQRYAVDIELSRDSSRDSGGGTGQVSTGAYAYQAGTTGERIVTPVGIAFSVFVFTDTGFSTPLAVHVTDRWEDYVRRREQIDPQGITDREAFHSDESGEFAALTRKTTPVNADLLPIEDSADSNSKKYIQLGDLPSLGNDANAIHDNVAGEINAVTRQTILRSTDVALIEASGSGFAKRSELVGNFGNPSSLFSITSNIVYTASNTGAQALWELHRGNILQLGSTGTGVDLGISLPSLGSDRPSWLNEGDRIIVWDANPTTTEPGRIAFTINTSASGQVFDTLSINNMSAYTTGRNEQIVITVPAAGVRVWQVTQLVSGQGQSGPSGQVGGLSSDMAPRAQSTDIWSTGPNDSAYRAGDVIIAPGAQRVSDNVLDHVTESTLSSNTLTVIFDDYRALLEFWGAYDSAMPAIVSNENGDNTDSASIYFLQQVVAASQALAPKLPVRNPTVADEATMTGISFHSAGQVQVGYTDNSGFEAGTVVGGYVSIAGTGTVHDGIWEIAPGGLDESANTVIFLNPAINDNSNDVSGPAGTITNVFFLWKSDVFIDTGTIYRVMFDIYAADDVNTAYPSGAIQSSWFNADYDPAANPNTPPIYIHSYQEVRDRPSAMRVNGRNIQPQDGSIRVTQSGGSVIDRYYPNQRQDVLYIDNTAAASNYQLHRNMSINNPTIVVNTDANSINYIPNPTTFTSDQTQVFTIISDPDNDNDDVQVGIGSQGNVRRFDNGPLAYNIAAGEALQVMVWRANDGEETGARVISPVNRSGGTSPTSLIDTSATTFTSASLNPVPVAGNEFDQGQDQDPGNTVFVIGGISGSASENGFQMRALGRYRLVYYMDFLFNGTQPPNFQTATVSLTPFLGTTELLARRQSADLSLVRPGGTGNGRVTIRMELEYLNQTVDQTLRVKADVADLPTGITFSSIQYQRRAWFIEYVGN